MTRAPMGGRGGATPGAEGAVPELFFAMLKVSRADIRATAGQVIEIQGLSVGWGARA